MELIIGTDGKGYANTHNSTFGINGVGEATVSNDGSVEGWYAYPGKTYGLKGKVSINDAGHLVGVFQEYYENVLLGSLSIDLLSQ